MDPDAELQKFKWLLLGAVAFCVSGCLSFAELNYWARGATTDAVVDEVVNTERGRRNRPIRLVKYHYGESDGTVRRFSDELPPDWVPPGDPGTVPVRFIPGSEYSSEVVGFAPTWPPFVFGGSVLLLAFGVWKLARQANAPPPRRTYGGSVRGRGGR